MRLFVAVRFSPAVNTTLLDAADALRRQGTGTFTRAENLHLTLAFIGGTEDLETAKAALDEVRTDGPVSLAVSGLGRFGDLWWAGIEKNAPLERLALGVQDTLRKRGFPIERRPWSPHVTLVRRWRGPLPAVTVPRTEMEVRRISLMESKRVDGKLIYTERYGRNL